MMKITQEVASILQAQINNEPYESSLSKEQLEQINEFARGYDRSGYGFYPLKSR